MTISFIGYENYVQNGLNINLGQDLYLAADMKESGVTLQNVEINAGSDVINADRTGAKPWWMRLPLTRYPPFSVSNRFRQADPAGQCERRRHQHRQHQQPFQCHLH